VKMEDIVIFKSDKISSYFASLKKDTGLTQGFWIIQRILPVVIRLIRDTNNPGFTQALKNIDEYLKPKQKIFGLAHIMLLNLEGEIVYSSDPAYSQKHFLKPAPDPDADGKERRYGRGSRKSHRGGQLSDQAL